MLWTLFLKEFFSYFRTKVAYFIMFIYALLSMFTCFYLGSFFILPSTDLGSLFFFQPDIFAILIPALTIKLWADENKTGTIELLISQPISFFNLVFSKFLACFTICLLMILLTVPLWGWTSLLTSVDNANVFSSYIACVFCVASMCALGCFISAFNKNPITAYIISVFVLWGMIVGNFSFLSSGGSEFLTQIWLKAVQSLNFTKNFSDIAQGQIGLDNIIYFIVIVVLALWSNIYLLLVKFEKNRKLLGFISIQLLTGVLIIFTSAILFGSYKFDLTSSKLYTVSQAGKDALKKVDTTVYVDLYVSAKLAEEYPAMANYMQTVVRYLQKFSFVDVTIKTVEPYSEAEKEAQANNLEAFWDTNNKYKMYFGAVLKSEQGKKVVINSFDEQNQAYLEYDIIRPLLQLLYPSKKTVGIVDVNLSVMKKRFGVNRGKNWKFVDELSKYYKVMPVFSSSVQIPAHIDILLLVNPQNMKPLFIYALDQFVMRGGNLLILNDPMSENEAEINNYVNVEESNLNILYKNWGFEYLTGLAIGDENNASEELIKQRLQKYPLYFEPQYTNHSLVSGLKTLQLKVPGAFQINGKDGATLTTLMKTSKQGGQVDAYLVKYTDKGNVLEKYKNHNQEYILGLLIEGEFMSKFESNPVSDLDYANKMLPHILYSLNKNKIIIVGDSDIVGNLDEVKKDEQLFLLRSVDYLADNFMAQNLSSKEIKTSSVSLYDHIQKRFGIKYNSQVQDLQNSILDLEAKINWTNHEIKLNSMNVSISAYKDMETMQTELMQLQNDIQSLQYKTEQSAKMFIYFMVVFTAVVFPALLVLLFAFIFVVLRRKYVQI